MEKNPHLLIEGMILSAYAIQANVGYLYLRGEFAEIERILTRALAEARAAGCWATTSWAAASASRSTPTWAPGPTSAGRRRRCSPSLEGYRGQPRSSRLPGGRGPLRLADRGQQHRDAHERSPHPAPRRAWFRQWGTEKSAGTKILSVSGPVRRPATMKSHGHAAGGG